MSKTYKNRLISFEYLSLGSGWGIVASTIWNDATEGLADSELLFLLAILCILLMLYRLEYKIFDQLEPFQFRKGSSAGLWTCCVLPITLMVQIYSNEKLNSLRAINLQWMWYLTSLCTFSSSLFVISALCGSSEPKKLFRSAANILFCVVLTCIGFAMMHFVAKIAITTSFFLSASSQLTFFYLIWYLPESFQRTFSFGEVLLISQCVSSFVSASVCHIFLHLSSHELPALTDQIALFVEVSLLGCILVIITCARLCSYYKPSISHVILSFVLVGFMFVLPLLHLVLRINPILWGLNFLVDNNQRLSLFGLWLILLLMSIIFVYSQSTLPSVDKPTTILRKYFHLMVLGVFFPGLILDPQFLRLSSALLFGLFIVLEYLRFLDISPISDVLNQHLKFFLDEKDQGHLITSHIYLLVGSSIPIWFCSSGIHSFAGVISIGIGDAFASVGGKIFGTHRWPETSKTIEGTAISIISQLITVNILEKTDIFPASTTYAVAGVIISTSLLEAFTTHIDNLVIPLVFFILATSVVSVS